MSWLRGVVKEVGSGDQLTVVSIADHAAIPKDCPEVRAEKRLTLSGVRAPRLGRLPGRGGANANEADPPAAEVSDEACARQARQALRRKVVGKPVVFKIDSVNATSGMEFGSVFVGQENVALSQVLQGLAKVNPNGLRDFDAETERQFKQAEETAKERGLGLWKNNNTTTTNNNNNNNNTHHNANKSSDKTTTTQAKTNHHAKKKPAGGGGGGAAAAEVDSFYDMTEKKKKRSGGGKKKKKKQEEAAKAAAALALEEKQQREGVNNHNQHQQHQQQQQMRLVMDAKADQDDAGTTHYAPMHTKTVQVSGQAANEALFNKYRALGVPVKAFIEHVGSGHILRASIPCLLAEEEEGENKKKRSSGSSQEVALGYETATVFVAGIACPNVKPRATDGGPVSAEPFAVKSKVLVENLVLNQEVSLKFEALDKYGNLFVSVFRTYDKNNEAATTLNLAETLLKEGLAKVIDWSSRMLPPMSASRLRQAEKTSKQAKANIWYNYLAPSEGEGGSLLGTSEFKATVMEVVSGDTLVLWLPKERTEKRIQLSSIRAPRLASRRQGGGEGNQREGEPYAAQAKEFLRSKLIGREVNVKMEYERKVPLAGSGGGGGAPPPASSDGAAANTQQQQQTRTLTFANVTLEERTGGISKTSNVSIMLLVRGLAQTVKHRSDDDMSSVYEDLVEAESKALKSKKGIHSGKIPAPPGRINDLSSQGSQAKSKQFLPFLQRSDRVHAVVDYVLSGHRFKISIPKDSLSITFALSDVRCPGRGEPFSEEALKYAKVHCMQRDVDLEVHSIDKMGTFTGKLYLTQNRGIDFAQALVASGLAKIQGYNVSAGSPLVHAQNKAKDGKLNIWKDYKEPSLEEEELAAKHSAEAKVETMKIRAVNVIRGNMFYAQRVDDQTASLLGEISSLSLSETTGGTYQVGEVVLCKYAGDGQVYRAKIEGCDRAAKTYDVFYVDFGNREKAAEKSISSLPLGLKTSNALAFACQLAFVKAPTLEEDFGIEAAEFLQSLVGQGQVLTAQVEDRVTDVLQGKKAETITKVSLVDPATNENVALEMVRNGLCRVERIGKFAKTKEMVRLLREEEAVAKKDHLNMWQYGDCGSDDEDQPAAWGRR